MPTLSEMRAEWAAQNPDAPGTDPYADLSDRELADRIYANHYQQVMQRDMFDERIGYKAGTGERVMRKMFGAGELDVGIVKGMGEAIGGPASREQMKQSAAAGIFELIGGSAAAAKAEIEDYASTFSPVRTMQRVLFPQLDPALEAGGELLQAGSEDMFAAAADTAPVADPNAGILEERMIGAARSAPVMAGAMAAGVVGGPGAASVAAGAGQYGLGFAEAERVDRTLRAAGKPGLSIEQKRGFAGSTAIVEGLMEYGPAKVALKAGTPLLKRIFQLAGVDVPSEVATTILQQRLGESYDVNKPLTAEQWTKAISDTVIETALLAGPTAIVGQAKDMALEPVRRRQAEAELDAQRRAQQAADDDRFMDEDLGGMMDAAFGPRPNQPPGSPGAPAGLAPPEDPAQAAGIQPGTFEDQALKTPRAQRLFGEFKQLRAKIDQALTTFNAMPKGSPEAAAFYNNTILPMEERAYDIDNDELATEMLGKPIDPVMRKPKPEALRPDPAYKARPSRPTETPPPPPQPEPAPQAAPAPAATPPTAQAVPEPSAEAVEPEPIPGFDRNAEVAAFMQRPGQREAAAAQHEQLKAELLAQPDAFAGAAPAAPQERPDIPVESEEEIAARLDQAKPRKGGFRITRPAFDQAKLAPELADARELLEAAEQARKVAAKKSTKPKERKELLARAAAAEDRIPGMIGSVRNKHGDEAADTFDELVRGRRHETATMTIDLDGSPVTVTLERNGIGFSDETHDSAHFEFHNLPPEYSETGFYSHFASTERDRDFTPEEVEAGAREILAKRKAEQVGQTRARQNEERKAAKRKAKAEAAPQPERESSTPDDWFEFDWQGGRYRASRDLLHMERKDKKGWTRTGSANVRTAAQMELAKDDGSTDVLEKMLASLEKRWDELDDRLETLKGEKYSEAVDTLNSWSEQMDQLIEAIKRKKGTAKSKPKAQKPQPQAEASREIPIQEAFEANAFTPASVTCPACLAKIGSPCLRPSGHAAANYHKDRKERADEAFEEKYGEDAIIEYDVRADRWGVINPKNNEWLAHASKYGPHNQNDAPKKPKAADKRGKRPQANAEKHDLLAFIALSSPDGKRFGLSSEEAVKQGLDPADMRDAYTGTIYRPFVKGGASFDAMAELLDEAGFPVTETIGGQQGATPNKLLELLDRALRGEKIYSMRNTQAFEDQATERARQFEEIDAAASSAGTEEWQKQLADRYENELADARAWAADLEKAEGTREHERNVKLLKEAHKDGHADLVVQYMANVNALADRFELEAADPKDYGMTAWTVGEEPGVYRVREQDLFGKEIPQPRTRKPSTHQTDLFAGSEADQAAHVMRMDLAKRKEEVDAKLAGDKSVPLDINNGDLFSKQIDLTDAKPAAVRKAEPVPGEIDVILPAAPKPELDARFAPIAHRVGLTAYGVIDGPRKIRDAMDVARIVKGILGNKPQEQFLVIVTDKDERPLAVMRHTVGMTDQSQVEPSMALGPIFDIDGARYVYFAHQHPSGVPDPSAADHNITEVLTRALSGSGIDFRGHMVLGVGADRATLFDAYQTITSVQGISEPDDPGKLPLVERTFDVVRPPGSRPIVGPQQALAFVEQNDLESGIVFLDTRHNVRGFMPMSVADMAKLKTDDPKTGMGAVLRAVHQLNAASIFTVATADRAGQWLAETKAMQNVGQLARLTGVRMLDGIIRLTPRETSGAPNANHIAMSERGIDLSSGTLYANPIRELARMYQRLVAKPLIDYWNHHVGWRYHPLKQLPAMNQFLNLRYKLLGQIDKVSRHIVRDVFDVFSEARGKPDESAVFHFLTNRGVSPNVIVDPAIRTKAMAVKRLFRNIGREWVRLGVLPASSVNSMADQYLPRLYLRHIMGNNAFAEFGSGRKPSKMGWRRRRSNIDQLTRDIVLGEIKDPSFLAAVGLGTQLRDMHVLQFLHAISANQNWVQPRSFASWRGMRVTPQWLASEADHIEEQSEFYLPADRRTALAMAAAMRTLARLTAGRLTAVDPDLWRQLPDTPRYGHLRGAWVRKEIFDDLMGIDTILPADASMVERVLSPSSTSGRISAWWKTTRVTLNPPTQVRNFMSNLILLHLSGVPARRIYSGELIARVLRDRIAGGKYFRIAEKYGLFATTFSSQELANVESEWLKIQLRMRRGGIRGSLAHARAIGEAVVKHAGNAYSMIEYLAKMAKVIDAMEREGMSEQDAMLEAQKWLFDYSLVPRTLRFLRNAPIGAPFLTFLYKAAPRIAEAALMRPWTMALYTAVVPYLTVMMYGLMNGDDEELTQSDVDAIKTQMPEWAQKRGNLLFLPVKDAEGRWQFLDLGFLVPWGMFSDASRIIQSPMPLGEKVNELRKAAGVGGGPILDPLVATMTGEDPFRGTPIANESDPPSMQAAAYLTYLANVWIPPWLHGLAAGETKGHAANIVDAVTGENVNYRTHEPSRTTAQATAAMFGLTTVPVSQHHSPAALLRTLDYEIRQVEQRRTQAIRNAKSEEEREEIKELYRLEIGRRKAQIDEVNKARDRLSNRGKD